MKPLKLGPKGYFGFYTNAEKNLKVIEMNKLVDEYNSSINSFSTREEQIKFDITINNKIKEISQSINN